MLREMKVCRPEVSDLSQLLKIRDDNRSPAPLGQAGSVQGLERSVHVNRSEPDRIRELLLRHWQLVITFRSNPDGIKPVGELA